MFASFYEGFTIISVYSSIHPLHLIKGYKTYDPAQDWTGDLLRVKQMLITTPQDHVMTFFSLLRASQAPLGSIDTYILNWQIHIKGKIANFFETTKKKLLGWLSDCWWALPTIYYSHNVNILNFEQLINYFLHWAVVCETNDQRKKQSCPSYLCQTVSSGNLVQLAP